MSAELDMTNDRVNVAYIEANGRPWWYDLQANLVGSAMKQGMTVDQWRKQAGLGWTAEFRELSYLLSDGTRAQLESRAAIVRSDTQKAIGFASPHSYNIVQPEQLFETYQHFAADTGATLETAGSLRGGSVIWALARLNEPVVLPGGDTSFPYFLLSTSFDGSSATHARYTMIRVVCMNTLSIAVPVSRDGQSGEDRAVDKSAGISIPHASLFKPGEVANAVSGLRAAAAVYQQQALDLQKLHISDTDAVAYFMNLLASYGKDGQITKQSGKNIENVIKLFRTGPGAEMAGDTAWGLVNAMTRFVDHDKRASNPGNRLYSAWMGEGNALKDRAFNKAMEMLAA